MIAEFFKHTQNVSSFSYFFLLAEVVYLWTWPYFDTINLIYQLHLFVLEFLYA